MHRVLAPSNGNRCTVDVKAANSVVTLDKGYIFCLKFNPSPLLCGLERERIMAMVNVVILLDSLRRGVTALVSRPGRRQRPLWGLSDGDVLVPDVVKVGHIYIWFRTVLRNRCFVVHFLAFRVVCIARVTNVAPHLSP